MKADFELRGILQGVAFVFCGVIRRAQQVSITDMISRIQDGISNATKKTDDFVGTHPDRSSNVAVLGSNYILQYLSGVTSGIDPSRANYDQIVEYLSIINKGGVDLGYIANSVPF